jgi:hypothetical protein
MYSTSGCRLRVRPSTIYESNGTHKVRLLNISCARSFLQPLACRIQQLDEPLTTHNAMKRTTISDTLPTPAPPIPTTLTIKCTSRPVREQSQTDTSSTSPSTASTRTCSSSYTSYDSSDKMRLTTSARTSQTNSSCMSASTASNTPVYSVPNPDVDFLSKSQVTLLCRLRSTTWRRAIQTPSCRNHASLPTTESTWRQAIKTTPIPPCQYHSIPPTTRLSPVIEGRKVTTAQSA